MQYNCPLFLLQKIIIGLYYKNLEFILLLINKYLKTKENLSKFLHYIVTSINEMNFYLIKKFI